MTTIADLVNPISIHALHYRVRFYDISQYANNDPFQSTHSITECDANAEAQDWEESDISIHALHYRVRS